MQIHHSKAVKLLIVLAWGLASLAIANGSLSKEEAAKLLPDTIGVFRASAPAFTSSGPLTQFAPENFGAVSKTNRKYTSDKSHEFTVEVWTTQMDSGAYALLAYHRSVNMVISFDTVGTASIIGPHWIFFTKGNTFVQISQPDNKASYAEELMSLAKGLAERIDKGDGDIHGNQTSA